MRVIGTGQFTTADCVGLVKRVMADPRNRPESSALIDLRNATYHSDNLAEVIDIATALETFYSLLKTKIAIVAKQSLLLPAEVVATHVRTATHAVIRVFVDVAAAEAFLQGKSAGVRRHCHRQRQRHRHHFAAGL